MGYLWGIVRPADTDNDENHPQMTQIESVSIRVLIFRKVFHALTCATRDEK